MYYVHTNHRNQPHLATDEDGQVVWRGVSTPFGSTSIDNGQGGPSGLCLNLRLPGQYFDAETGFHHNYHRDYSPDLGRYLQADPIGLNGGMNLYGYCDGDPVNREDRWGLFETGGYGGYSDDFGTDDDDDNYGVDQNDPENQGGPLGSYTDEETGIRVDVQSTGRSTNPGTGNGDSNPYDDPENDDSRPATNNFTVNDDDLEIELSLEEEGSSFGKALEDFWDSLTLTFSITPAPFIDFNVVLKDPVKGWVFDPSLGVSTTAFGAGLTASAPTGVPPSKPPEEQVSVMVSALGGKYNSVGTTTDLSQVQGNLGLGIGTPIALSTSLRNFIEGLGEALGGKRGDSKR
jgi:RHS repeat-associated protein